MVNSPLLLVTPPAIIFGLVVFFKVIVAYSRGCLEFFSITFPVTFSLSLLGCA